MIWKIPGRVTSATRRGILLLAEGLAMKYHEYKTLWDEMRGRLPRHVTEERFYAVAMAGGARAGNGLVLADDRQKYEASGGDQT
jgi:hypothetical protein